MEVITSNLSGNLLRIPDAVAAKIGLRADSAVDIAVIGRSLVIRPAGQRRLELEELLASITDENRHGETDTGPAIGGEVW